MRLTKFGCLAFLAAMAYSAGAVNAQAPVVRASDALAGYGSANRTTTKLNSEFASVIPTAYSCGDSPICGCEIKAPGCDNGCDSMGGGDEPWKLVQRSILGFDIGGWTSVGYHTYDNPGIFNNHSDRVNLHQAWLYAERVADGSKGIGLGGRIDYIYGVDAQDTQAFGLDDGHWDNAWDNGIYGHAIPQLYGQVAIGDNFNVKIGKFFTIIGYEVVAATGNFFYSHSYTMYNSEPFTHTGVLTEYAFSDNITLFNGWVMGWDSGFRDNGDAYLGGAAVKLTDNTDLITSIIFGNFGASGTDSSESGFMVSNILTTALSDKWNYVLWVDVLDTEGTGRAVERRSFDLNQYLLYTINDKLIWGNRIEWYNQRGIFSPNTTDIYAFTTGLNYRFGSNMLFRPELRWDWDKGDVIGLGEPYKPRSVPT